MRVAAEEKKLPTASRAEGGLRRGTLATRYCRSLQAVEAVVAVVVLEVIVGFGLSGESWDALLGDEDGGGGYAGSQLNRT